MPSPTPNRHRATRDAVITVIRSYKPDRARCVAALVTLLSYQPDSTTLVDSSTAEKDTPENGARAVSGAAAAAG
jgi:hypothetical protein